jgi:hypothetical protein
MTFNKLSTFTAPILALFFCSAVVLRAQTLEERRQAWQEYQEKMERHIKFYEQLEKKKVVGYFGMAIGAGTLPIRLTGGDYSFTYTSPLAGVPGFSFNRSVSPSSNPVGFQWYFYGGRMKSFQWEWGFNFAYKEAFMNNTDMYGTIGYPFSKSKWVFVPKTSFGGGTSAARLVVLPQSGPAFAVNGQSFLQDTQVLISQNYWSVTPSFEVRRLFWLTNEEGSRTAFEAYVSLGYQLPYRAGAAAFQFEEHRNNGTNGRTVSRADLTDPNIVTTLDGQRYDGSLFSLGGMRISVGVAFCTYSARYVLTRNAKRQYRKFLEQEKLIKPKKRDGVMDI